jgi:hypothetical protein
MSDLDQGRRSTLAAIADRLIPAAHGMPSAAEVVDDQRLQFVLTARPDLGEPLLAALRHELGDDVQSRLDGLGRSEPANLAALQLVIVGGYYTDERVRGLLGYRGQEAIAFDPLAVPEYVEEGLVDAVVARGPIWRDPRTGMRADRAAEGGQNGRDRT